MEGRTNKGYSLIELLIAIQIFMIVVTMIYTIYLMGFRYIINWNRDNEIIRAELLIEKAINSKFNQSKKLLGIDQTGLIFLNKWYRTQAIHWGNNAFYLDSLKVTPGDIQINVTQLLFLKNYRQNIYTEVTFEEADLNRDGRLIGAELTDLNTIKFLVEIISKKTQKISSFNFILPPHTSLINQLFPNDK